MLDALEANGQMGDVRQILAAVAVPLLELGPSSGYYVRFLARVTQDQELSSRLFNSLDENTSGGGRRVNEALHAATSHLPDRVRDQRIRMALNLVTGELARRAASAEAGHSTAPPDIFLDDLLDAAVGLLVAPVSRKRSVARRQASRPPARGK
jgi:hypothetical protein